jgi:hypothetical protein
MVAEHHHGSLVDGRHNGSIGHIQKNSTQLGMSVGSRLNEYAARLQYPAFFDARRPRNTNHSFFEGLQFALSMVS